MPPITEGLCPTCESIRMPAQDDRDAWIGWKFVHHSLPDVKESARRGCPLCYCMATSSELHRNSVTMAFGQPKDFEQHIRIRLQTRKAESSDKADYLLAIQLDSPDGMWAYRRPNKFLGVSRWSPGPENDNAGASDNYHMCWMNPRDCLDMCVEKHKMECPSKADRFTLPRRLIDVSSGELDLSLIDTSEDRGPWSNSPNKQIKYAALSYCWGRSNTFTTTSANLHLRRSGFVIESLPATLRDAVRLTRDLRIPYLWVDALCIIQGDDAIAQEDKKVEMRIMADIYANSHLTIEAADACHANGGLFPKGRSIVNSTVNGSYMVVASLSPDEWTRHENHYAQHPINRRAWTLQEHLLSRRVLSFTRNGVEWQCRVDLPGQTARENFPPGPFGRLIIGQQGSDKLSDWTNIVENFSGRDVTIASDRLPALSALARRYSTEWDRYLAGLWETDICKYLLWYRSSAAATQSSKPNFSRVQRDPAIPSWSWASVTVRVCFVTDETYWERRPTAATTLTLRSYNLNLQDEQNPFGAVLEGGYLELNGPIFRGTLSRYHQHFGNSAEWQRDGSERIFCPPLDENVEEVRRLLPEGSQAWLLVVFDSAKDKRLVGILLRRLEHKEGKQEYARIGLLFAQDTLQAESAQRQTVVVR